MKQKFMHRWVEIRKENEYSNNNNNKKWEFKNEDTDIKGERRYLKKTIGPQASLGNPHSGYTSR